jgi:DNA (cytosine-5)-methyltransferase 1
MNKQQKIIGVDLFAGAGGMSLGAQLAGVDVRLAIEIDRYACATYRANHPQTKLLVKDIRSVMKIPVVKKGHTTVLFGGPPCQGFSTSNQRTRSRANINNWMFQEFLRLVDTWKPDWVIFENVKGIVDTEGGLFKEGIIDHLTKSNYTTNSAVLCAADYGVPQYRQRFFLVASRHGKKFQFPAPSRSKSRHVTLVEAISDLPDLENGAKSCYLPYQTSAKSSYARQLRSKSRGCSNHLVTRNSSLVLERYTHIPQGGNWENIPDSLMKNYKDKERCHTGIYKRLKADAPSIVIGNFRKNMLIHPTKNRGLSVREAARIQSFPDQYEFKGSIGFQQQQVGNAVPPLLAKVIRAGSESVARAGRF